MSGYNSFKAVDPTFASQSKFILVQGCENGEKWFRNIGRNITDLWKFHTAVFKQVKHWSHIIAVGWYRSNLRGNTQ